MNVAAIEFNPKQRPMLFGLERSNKDFSDPICWGKNQFNNCFPAALACYMGYKGIPLVYLMLNQNLAIAKSAITTEQLFTLKELSPNLFFNFEFVYSPYAPYALNDVPRVDLVLQDLSKPGKDPIRAIEIKLTALPDHTTAHLADEAYGCEIVVRPDTIIYLAMSIAAVYENDRQNLLNTLQPVCSTITDWSDGLQTHPLIHNMAEAMNQVLAQKLAYQSPLLMQPVWKTMGKLQILADQCFDIFVWSNFALTRLFVNTAYKDRGITRHARTLIWLTKMLWDFAQAGRFAGRNTIEQITYNTKNDKAFASSGSVTRQFMASEELRRPRIEKEAVRDCIRWRSEISKPRTTIGCSYSKYPGFIPPIRSMTLRVVDLFSGCGGLSLGFAQAGFDIVAAFDNWQPALNVYRANLQTHPALNYDLSNFQGDTSVFAEFAPDIIIGGPPCQDFSSAGKRDESLGRADLTKSFASIIHAIRPQWFVMENVERAFGSHALAAAREIFRQAGYALSEAVLDASLCGVPQLRKRLFVIGDLGGQEGAALPYLEKYLSDQPMTVRDYFGDKLGVEHYYRHPRSYARRGVFSVDEPSPTIRGVNRPVPPGYKPHAGDTASPSPKLRPLTTKERSMIQTFPENFIWTGTKADVEQMIGNAVPVKLAEYVANRLLEYITFGPVEMSEAMPKEQLLLQDSFL